MTKKYSHVVAMKKSEGEAFVHAEAFPTKDAEIREVTVGGEQRKVANFGIALNNANRTLSYGTGVEIEAVNDEGLNYVDVALWGAQAERAVKVIKKGNLISVTGVLKVVEHEGKKQLRFTAEGFNILRFKDGNGKGAESAPEPVAAGAGAGAQDDLPF